MGLRRLVIATALFASASAASARPASADVAGFAPERPALSERVPAQLLALVPAPLLPLLQRRLGGNRSKPGGTSLFVPSAMVPLIHPREAMDMGLGFGRAGAERALGDHERSTVVVVYLAMGW